METCFVLCLSVLRVLRVILCVVRGSWILYRVLCVCCVLRCVAHTWCETTNPNFFSQRLLLRVYCVCVLCVYCVCVVCSRELSIALRHTWRETTNPNLFAKPNKRGSCAPTLLALSSPCPTLFFVLSSPSRHHLPLLLPTTWHIMDTKIAQAKKQYSTLDVEGSKLVHNTIAAEKHAGYSFLLLPLSRIICQFYAVFITLYSL